MALKKNKKNNPMGKVFGALKEWKINTQKFKDEIRKQEALAEKRKNKV